MSKSLSHLANARVSNLAHGLREVINQLKNANPQLSLYMGQGDSNSYDPMGLIEKIYLRLACLDNEDMHFGGIVQHGESSDGLLYERNGNYDHKPLLYFLEETLNTLESREFNSILSFHKFYIAFRNTLWELRTLNSPNYLQAK